MPREAALLANGVREAEVAVLAATGSRDAAVALLAATGSRDAAVAALAERQHGAISTRQLLKIGFTRHEIQTLVRRRRLHPVFRGVHAVGHERLGPLGLRWAAVLATGGAVSHRCAADALGLLPYLGRAVQVSTTGGARSRRGIRVHRVRELDPDEVGGLPVTAVAQTLLDLAATEPRRRVDSAVNQAQILEVYDHRALSALATSGRPGARALRGAIDACAVPVVLRSELERRFLELVTRPGLPRPRVNAQVLGYEVDFLWPEAGLVVELDGVRYHETARAKERDPVKDNALLLAGLRVLRYRWRRVTRAEEEVRAELRRALG
jgi:very-short-patch-repair endonuclease